MSDRFLHVLGAIALLGVFLAVPCTPVRADTTVFVTVGDDTAHGCATSGIGTCSLRDAVTFGNGHDHTMISIVGTFPILLTGGQLDIAANTTIHGTTTPATVGVPPGTTISARNSPGLGSRIFNILSNKTVDLQYLDLAGGTAPDTGNQPSNDRGGAIYLASNSTLTIKYCQFVENTVEAGGATPAAHGQLGVDAAGGAIYADSGTTLRIVNSNFRYNGVAGGKGGDGNTGEAGGAGGAGRGGAIYFASGTLDILGGVFEENEADGGFGGDSDVQAGNGGDASGGAVYSTIFGALGNTSEIKGSAFTYNKVHSGEGGFGTGASLGGNAFGGAVFTSGNVGNVSIDHNGAIPSFGQGGNGVNVVAFAQGGGIYSPDNQEVRGYVVNSTIVSNVAGRPDVPDPAGTFYQGGGVWGASISNTIFTLNRVDGVDVGNQENDCASTYNFFHNIEWNPGKVPTCAAANEDPMLTAPEISSGIFLGFHVGFALATGSPAINAGDNAACAAAPVYGVDQRGVKRPSPSIPGNNCAIGAYEVGLSITSITPDMGGTGGGYTVTISGGGFYTSGFTDFKIDIVGSATGDVTHVNGGYFHTAPDGSSVTFTMPACTTGCQNATSKQVRLTNLVFGNLPPNLSASVSFTFAPAKAAPDARPSGDTGVTGKPDPLPKGR